MHVCSGLKSHSVPLILSGLVLPDVIANMQQSSIVSRTIRALPGHYERQVRGKSKIAQSIKLL